MNYHVYKEFLTFFEEVSILSYASLMASHVSWVRIKLSFIAKILDEISALCGNANNFTILFSAIEFCHFFQFFFFLKFRLIVDQLVIFLSCVTTSITPLKYKIPLVWIDLYTSNSSTHYDFNVVVHAYFFRGNQFYYNLSLPKY